MLSQHLLPSHSSGLAIFAMQALVIGLYTALYEMYIFIYLLTSGKAILCLKSYVAFEKESSKEQKKK